jgi:hypothetical protein
MIYTLMTTLDIEAESPFGLKVLKMVSGEERSHRAQHESSRT